MDTAEQSLFNAQLAYVATQSRQMKFILATISFIAVAGCASLGAADCGPDWHAIGQRDGRLGASPQAEAYARRCGLEVDSASYLRGWQEGFSMRPRPTV